MVDKTRLQGSSFGDVAPTEAEIEREKRRHAQLKATEAVIGRLSDRGEIPSFATDRGELITTLAAALGFEDLADVSLRSFRGSTGTYLQDHLEPHEKPDPDEFERQAPPEAHSLPYSVDDEVRAYKSEAFLRVQRLDFDEIEVAAKIFNPFAAKLAVAVRVGETVATNDVLEDAARMHKNGYYTDRFDWETIQKYRGRARSLERTVARSA